MNVGRRMTRNPKTVAPDVPLARAAALMREQQVKHLPVMEGDRLVGILSDTDLRNASLAAEGGGGAAAGAQERRVRDVMCTEVWSLTPEDSLEDALLVIRRMKFGALPVLSGGRLVGIISKIDLINAFIDVLNIDDVGLRVEVVLSPDLSRFEELVGILREMRIAIRSCLISPQDGEERMTAILRLDTFNGPLVRGALRARRFDVVEPSSPDDLWRPNLFPPAFAARRGGSPRGGSSRAPRACRSARRPRRPSPRSPPTPGRRGGPSGAGRRRSPPP